MNFHEQCGIGSGFSTAERKGDKKTTVQKEKYRQQIFWWYRQRKEEAEEKVAGTGMCTASDTPCLPSINPNNVDL